MNSKEMEKKQKELERLEEMKQAMRSETTIMVEKERSELNSHKSDIQEIIDGFNKAGRKLNEAFKGEASEAAEQNITKLKNRNIALEDDFDFLVDSFKVY
ncbi:hypothetical protein [Staphylococcus pettenkoferi]|uniref:Uncharacterized protein n=1 Tax=Staphylococcus pettenkoferi TaxID=170573 RepID=A0A9Q4D6J2_9STAP|nr:hypothetical protein [Staphylococcus pettenkoferi]MCY1568774.1 hypothetical protein [Staphylococcus pettenkoferi]MCY1577118.1 hypothetical protein [Staphylococcus pettenkoferi]MCY1595533.1 hypothetical protein [Staphylococcus pettenkoferi]MCY1617550.1 hypothetical protein [Staphylococcus pettenkoferi]